MKVKDLLNELKNVDKNLLIKSMDNNIGNCSCNIVDIEVLEDQVILYTNMVGINNEK